MSDHKAAFERAAAEFAAAATSEDLASALGDMHRALSMSPETRDAVPKQRIINMAVEKRRAAGDAWTQQTAEAYGQLLSVYAAPVFPMPAYPGQQMPPAYLFTPPPPPAFMPPTAPVELPPMPSPSAPPAPDDAGSGAGAGAAAGAGAGDVDPPPYPLAGPSFFYAPPPPAGAAPIIVSPEQHIALGVPVQKVAPSAEYTLDFQDGVEKTTGELPCRPENLHRVTHINLWNNDVAVIEGLGRYPNLMRLTLKSNEIKSLKGIEECRSLRWLDVSDNDVKDCRGITSMHSVEWINLDNNDLADIDELAFLSNLTYLSLWHNDLKRLKGIETLPALRTVNLASNDLKAAAGLAHCKMLQEVDLRDNDLDHMPSVLALATCPHLQKLDLRGNKYNAKQVKQIRDHFGRLLPTCQVLCDEKGGDGGCAVM